MIDSGEPSTNNDGVYGQRTITQAKSTDMHSSKLAGDLVFDPIWESVARLGFLYYYVVMLPAIVSFGNYTAKVGSCYTGCPIFMQQKARD